MVANNLAVVDVSEIDWLLTYILKLFTLALLNGGFMIIKFLLLPPSILSIVGATIELLFCSAPISTVPFLSLPYKSNVGAI